jgi:hypothetical protein
MLQLGQASWFLPVGGMVLGGLRPETGEFCYRVLPVEFFQGERFQDRHYVQEACNLVAEILSGLNVPKHTEPLQICLGEYCRPHSALGLPSGVPVQQHSGIQPTPDFAGYGVVPALARGC